MREVYLPVAVTIDDNGNFAGAIVDFDGAPWMYVDSEDNIWGATEDEWTSDETLEARAIVMLYEALS